MSEVEPHGVHEFPCSRATVPHHQDDLATRLELLQRYMTEYAGQDFFGNSASWNFMTRLQTLLHSTVEAKCI